MTGKKGAAALDWWSWVHVASGMALAAVGLHWVLAMVAIVGYEAVEGVLRRFKTKAGAGVFEYESWPNIVMDVVVGAVGYFGTRLLFPDLRLLPWLP